MSPCPGCGCLKGLPFTGRDSLKLFVCPRCGSHFLDAAAYRQSASKLYRDRGYFEPWDLHPGSQAWRLREATARDRVALAWSLGLRGRWLDVGCAGGYLVKGALDQGYDAWGVELNPYAVKVAREAVPGRVRQGRFSATWPKGPLDVISFFDVLEHLPKPQQALSLARKRMAKGGALLLTVPDVDSLTRRLMRGAWAHYKMEHLYYPSRQALRGLLASQGFGVLYEAPAGKRLSLGLMLPLLERYPVPGTLTAARLASRLLPQPLQNLSFKITIGERLVVAQKQ